MTSKMTRRELLGDAGFVAAASAVTAVAACDQVAAANIDGTTLEDLAMDREIYRLARQAETAEAEYRRLDAIQGQMEDAGDMKGASAYEREVTDPAWNSWQDLVDAVRAAPAGTAAGALFKLRHMQADSCYCDDHVAPFVMRTLDSVVADLERMTGGGS